MAARKVSTAQKFMREQNGQDPSKPVIAAIYARLSYDRHGTGLAVERQLEECRRKAAERGFTVPDHMIITDNNMSATNGKERPGFTRLLKAIEDDEIQAVVAWAPDRLARKVGDLNEIIIRGEATGFKLVCVQGLDVDMSDSLGKMLASIITLFAELEVSLKSERQYLAEVQARMNGVMPAAKCFGYDPATSAIIEDEAVWVREVFRRFNNGAGVFTIAKWLNGEGVMNTRGNPWDRLAIRAMLTNARYIAKSTLNDGPNRRVIVGDGNWEPIVTEDEFARAGDKLGGHERRKFGRQGNTRKWMGSGFFTCAVCGDSVVTGYSGTKTVPVQTVRNYRCPNGHFQRKSAEVDEYVIPTIARVMNESAKLRAMFRNDPANGPEVAAKRAEQDKLRDYIAEQDKRLDAAGFEPEIEAKIVRRMNDAQVRINALEGEIAAGSTHEFTRLAGAENPGTVWLTEFDVNTQIAVGKRVCKVSLKPTNKGRRKADWRVEDTIDIDFFVNDKAVAA